MYSLCRARLQSERLRVGVLESREKIFHKKINLRRSHEKRARATNSGGLSSAISPGGFEWATNGHNQVVRRATTMASTPCITLPGLRGNLRKRVPRTPHSVDFILRCPASSFRRALKFGAAKS